MTLFILRVIIIILALLRVIIHNLPPTYPEKPPLIYKVTIGLYIATLIVLLSFWPFPDSQCVESILEQPPGGCSKSPWFLITLTYIMMVIADVITYRRGDFLVNACWIHTPYIYALKMTGIWGGFVHTIYCGMVPSYLLIKSIVTKPAAVTLSFVSQTRMIGFLAINILACIIYILNATRSLKQSLRTVPDVKPRQMSSKDEKYEKILILLAVEIYLKGGLGSKESERVGLHKQLAVFFSGKVGGRVRNP